LQLRARISLTLFIFSVIVALVIGTVGHVANERIEEEIWLQMLNSELEFQVRRSNQEDINTSEKLPQTTLYQGDPLKSLDSVPANIRHLDVGLHDELMFNDLEVCVLVKDIGPNRYFLVFDITDLEEAEHASDLVAVLVIMIVVGLVVWSSIYLGQWLTRPIYDLARKVETFSPSDKYQPIADNYRDHEVRKIAEAIDSFFVRLGLFIKREREFISMASHEFRTPLAVIAGARDVLSAVPDLPQKALKPLDRIKRVTEELNEMVSVLLLLTKEELSTSNLKEPQRFDLVLSSVVETHRELLVSKNISLECCSFEPTQVSAPQALLRVLASNLVRNAIQHMVSGTVTVSLKDHELQVKDSGTGVPPEIRDSINKTSVRELVTTSGLGLYIVRRITEGYGWEFQLLNRKEGGTIAAVSFSERESS